MCIIVRIKCIFHFFINATIVNITTALLAMLKKVRKHWICPFIWIYSGPRPVLHPGFVVICPVVFVLSC